MFNLGPMELVVILVLALLIFGPGKLPEVGQALGKSLNEFRRATRAVSDGPSAKPPASSGTEPAPGEQATRPVSHDDQGASPQAGPPGSEPEGEPRSGNGPGSAAGEGS